MATTKTLMDPVTGEKVDAKVPTESRENKDFIMMFRHFMSQISDLGMEDPQALRVLLFIARHMDAKNALAVTMSLMADMLGVSRQTISSKIKYLSAHGWIAVYRLGKQNVYVVNPDVFWTSYAAQKSYCKFETTIMLSSVDNWEMVSNNKMSLRHIDKDVLQRFAAQMEADEHPESAV